MTDTLVKHRRCDTFIFRVIGGIEEGQPVDPGNWNPLKSEWKQPIPGDPCICPNCGELFSLTKNDLIVYPKLK